MGDVRGLITNVDASILSGSWGIVRFEGKAYSVTLLALRMIGKEIARFRTGCP